MNQDSVFSLLLKLIEHVCGRCLPCKETKNHLISLKLQLSRVMRKPTIWFPSWSDTNQAVQLQKMARGLKFRI